MSRALVLLALALTLACALPGHARERGERILDYDVEITIQTDGSLDISERISVWAEGRQIRRGIVRDFPTRYRDRFGDRVRVDFSVEEVLRNGRPEPWFTERAGNGVVVNTGNDQFLPVPAGHVYTLHTRTNRQLGFFENHDELYFNAIGPGSRLRVERGSVTVRLPAAVPVAQMQVDGFTGGFGTRDKAFHATRPAPGTARWELTGPLAPGEGLTLVFGFPKGVVAEPGLAQRLAWRLRDNTAGIVALAGLALLLGFCFRRWRAIGRDPRAGTVIVRYEPPAGYSPAELRYMQRLGYDNTAFSADLLAAAVHGAVGIHREARRILSDRWILRPGSSAATLEAESAPALLLAQLLPADGKALELELDQSNATVIRKAVTAHRQRVGSAIVPALYRRNGGSLAVAGLIFVLTLAASLGTAFATGSGLVLAIPLLGAALLATITFGVLIGAPTPAGRRLLDEIEGFRRYLAVAEKQDLQKLEAPGDDEPTLDAGRFERLLPYAVALGVEEAWTRRFTLAVGAAAAAAATSSISWYSSTGRSAGFSGLDGMTRSLSKDLGARIASASSPPGSSSGFGGGSSGGGGGGFSGGGGGGGGVGGR